MAQDSSKLFPIKSVHDFARRNKIAAEYHLEQESGPAHAKTYTVRLRLREKDYIGADGSIRCAQRAAARVALDDLAEAMHADNQEQQSAQKNPTQSPIVELNAWATRHRVTTRYVLLHEEILPVTSPGLLHRTRSRFSFRLFIGGDLCFDGQGWSHQEARMNCAIAAWTFLSQNSMHLPSPTPAPPAETQTKSPVTLMYERAKQLDLPVQVQQNEPLTITFLIGDQYSATGTGTTKSLAKRVAAEKMLDLLPLTIAREKVKVLRKRTHQHEKFIVQKGAIDYGSSQEINPITRLYQIARAKSTNVHFEELEKPTNDRSFQCRVQFGEHYSADGHGQSKQAAKRSAAELLLSKLNFTLQGPVPSLPVTSSKSLLKRDEDSNRRQEKKRVHFDGQDIDPESSATTQQRIISACEKLKITMDYDNKLTSDDDQRHESILSLSIGDRLLARFRGHGSTAVRAQEHVSSTAWKNLQQLFDGSIQASEFSEH